MQTFLIVNCSVFDIFSLVYFVQTIFIFHSQTVIAAHAVFAIHDQRLEMIEIDLGADALKNLCRTVRRIANICCVSSPARIMF